MNSLAIFDLDGTITRHDTGAPYALGYVIRKKPWRLPMVLLALPVLLGYAVGLVDLGRLKSTFFRATLGGCHRKDIERWTAEFVARLVARGLFPPAVAAIQEHARAGDYLVLLSASMDLWVPAVGRALGFQEVICTGVRWDGERLDGALATPNRRGEEKARCVAALRARHPGVQAVAYANSGTDLAHLKLVDRGVLVNGSAAARRAAVRDGIKCTDWR